MSDPVNLLGWLCYLGAAAAIVVYLIHFAKRQGWRRPWNAAGLFFTAKEQGPVTVRVDAVAVSTKRLGCE